MDTDSQSPVRDIQMGVNRRCWVWRWEILEDKWVVEPAGLGLYLGGKNRALAAVKSPHKVGSVDHISPEGRGPAGAPDYLMPPGWNLGFAVN